MPKATLEGLDLLENPPYNIFAHQNIDKSISYSFMIFQDL